MSSAANRTRSPARSASVSHELSEKWIAGGSAAGTISLSPLAFDCGDNLFQRQIVEPFAALGRVVARSRPEMTQETKRVHDAQVPSQNLPRSAVDVGNGSNNRAHDTTFITSSSGVTTVSFRDFSRCALFRNLSSHVQKILYLSLRRECQMEIIEGLDSRLDRRRCFGLYVIVERDRLARSLQDFLSHFTSFGIGRALDLELQCIGGDQFQVAILDQSQNCEHGLGFEVHARLGSIVQGSLQTASVEIHAHAMILRR